MKLIKQILNKYRSELGVDFLAYHNHAQRVYYYAITLLLMKESKKLAIAAAFHDLDIWTGGSMDYLSGSEDLARKYLDKSDFGLLPDQIAFIIKQHHQLTRIKGDVEAEAFRKADLIDLTSGFIQFNIPMCLILTIEKTYPRERFTRIIAKKTLRHSLKNPLNPLPMIKW
ncbi:MAG: hypothetical protein JXR10_14925 [Cyclobacteriaceae bacterium]